MASSATLQLTLHLLSNSTRRVAATKACSPHHPPPPQRRRELLANTASLSVALSLSSLSSISPLVAKAEDLLSDWERVYLPIDPGVVLLDIAFVPDDPSHGFLLGTRQTILETKDGGQTWAPRSIPSAEEEDFNYRFNSISFRGKEGWIVGKPAILLYTSDAGDNWKRIPLSTQLPGDMLNVAPKGSNETQSHPSPKGKPSTILCSEKGPTPRDKQKGMMNSKAGKDSLKGVSIMVIMLIIMSIWGRLCAILCMSAWLYCIPLLRTYRDTTTMDVVGNMKIDMATKLFRKKVTLEGLLQTDT